MQQYKYIIIGGGMTADSAVKGIRQVDPDGTIAMFSSDSQLPYTRPLLSKALWKGEPFDSVWRRSPKENLDTYLQNTVKSINAKNKTITDEAGVEYSYDKLLIATGGIVNKFLYKAEGIIYFRTLDDYLKLRELTEQGESFCVIGAGFIGSEITAALAMNNKSVTMIFPGNSIGSSIYPAPLSNFLDDYYKSKGVNLVPGNTVLDIKKHKSVYYVRTSDGNELKFDGVVAGIGIKPNVDLAESAGLKTNNGILVDELLLTSHIDIYSAGDVANFYNPHLEKRIRVEHEDNANMMGTIAGKNMAGSSIHYDYLPYFYSDLFELGFEAIGELDAGYETIIDWKEEFHEGVIYYLNDERVKGVLLWNIWDQVDAARMLIADKGPFNKDNLKERLTELNLH